MNTNTKPADWDAWTKTFTYSDWKSEWADAPTFMAYVADKKWYVDFCKKNDATKELTYRKNTNCLQTESCDCNNCYYGSAE